jgi:hypothetical protein
MSWERPIGRNAVSRYYAKQGGSTTDAVSALVAYIIDLLEDKSPTIRDKFGDSTIYYHWFHANDPQQSMQTPAVGISLMAGETNTMGNLISTNDNFLLAGALMDAEITLVIIADSPRQREAISSKIFHVFNRWIYEGDSPITYIEKSGYGDDRGFSSIDRFVMSSLWQNLTEDKYLKIDTYTIGYVEFYREDDALPVEWAVIGSVRGSGDINDPYSGHTTVQVKFSINQS